MSDDKKRIIVRDRRVVHQFSIHNRVIDEWLPIIDKHGLALYCLYVRMANQKDERSYPGYTLIKAHLGMSAATVSNFNRLLTWCRLIYIEHGNRKAPNEYYILSVPHCTPEAIAYIERKVRATLKPKNTFLRALLNRLNTWQPIQARWKKTEKKVTVVHPAQLSLPSSPGKPPGSPGKPPSSPGEHPSSLGEHPSSLGEHPSSPGKQEQSETTIQNNNPKQQTPPAESKSKPKDDAVVVALTQLLSTFGIQEPTLTELANDSITIADARAWIRYARSQDSITNPPAFVIAKLRQHATAPPIKTKPGRKPPAEEVDAETRARQKAALAKLKRRQLPTVEDMPDPPVPDELLPPPN